jgi:hypothetical protein
MKPQPHFDHAETISKSNIVNAFVNENEDEAERIELFDPLKQHLVNAKRTPQAPPPQPEAIIAPTKRNWNGPFIWSDVIE